MLEFLEVKHDWEAIVLEFLKLGHDWEANMLEHKDRRLHFVIPIVRKIIKYGPVAHYFIWTSEK